LAGKQWRKRTSGVFPIVSRIESTPKSFQT